MCSHLVLPTSGYKSFEQPKLQALINGGIYSGGKKTSIYKMEGEADELIGEVARSEVNEMGDTMATAGGGGEASEPEVKKKKKSKWTKTTKTKKSHDQRKVERRDRADGNGG